MAAKIVRQPNKIALLGVPASAAALSPGREAAPSALRAVGLVKLLESLGYKVTDLGDDPVAPFKQDDESPRARNLAGVRSVIEALKPRVEQAIKSGALPLILSGDSSVALATVAGVRRYFRNVGVIYLDSYARLLTPATTSSGSLDGMIVSHLTGRGAPELVRFWAEPPLVREADLALFGVERAEPSEDQVFRTSPLRPYFVADIRKMGLSTAAQAAIDHVHGGTNAFVLHLSVSAINGFEATDEPASGGLHLEEVEEILVTAAKQQHLAAFEITAYNPEEDPGQRGAKIILDLLSDVLSARLTALEQQPAAESPLASVPESPLAAVASENIPHPVPGEAWPSDDLGDDPAPPETSSATQAEESDS